MVFVSPSGGVLLELVLGRDSIVLLREIDPSNAPEKLAKAFSRVAETGRSQECQVRSEAWALGKGRGRGRGGEPEGEGRLYVGPAVLGGTCTAL